MAYVAVITGASGFVGSEITKQLLERGYTVRATVRSLTDTDKVEHLKRLADALPGTLELHEADLLKDGSFDAPVAGAHFVFHVASPFQFPDADVDALLIQPAVRCAHPAAAASRRRRAAVWTNAGAWLR